MILNFDRSETHAAPFPHFRTADLLDASSAADLLDWLDDHDPWQLTVADFYEQHEFSLLAPGAPDTLRSFVSPRIVAAIVAEMGSRLGAPALELVDVCLHRLVESQTIRIHNDYLGPEESHRLVIQLNRGWTVEQGGLLMLFGADAPESVTDVILPAHRSGFGFEISDRSHHAVSTIHGGVRDSLIYTFRIAA